MSTTTLDRKAQELRGIDAETMQMFADIEAKVRKFSLADAIRQGSKVSEQAIGSFGSGETACAMTAAVIAAKAAGYM